MGALFLAAFALLSLDEVQDSRLTDYLGKIAARVAPERQLKVVLFEDSTVFLEPRYALLLRSATIQVPVSLMRLCESEAEVAAILAHTVAHINNPYIARPKVEGRPEIRWQISAADPRLIPFTMKSVVKERELRADASSVDHLLKAGYHPDSVVSLLLKLPTSEFNDEVRRSAARDAVADLQVPDNLKVDTSEFAEFRKVLDGLPSAPVKRRTGPPTLRRASER
jgi:predicted Zn-dependent protease